MANLKEELQIAKKTLLNHGIVAFPTETVMGLGVLYNDFDAYSKLNLVKRRPEDKPYTLMVKCKEDLNKYGVINESTQRVVDAFMPGSITIIVPVRKEAVPGYVTHNTDIIGMRIPTNKEAVKLLKEIGFPLLVPSANRSGEKPANSSEEAKAIFGSEVEAYISGTAQKLEPSTIVDLTKDEPVVVRVGPIKPEEILKAWKNA